MKNPSKQWAAVVALSLLIAQGSATADEAPPAVDMQAQQSVLLSTAFSGAPSASTRVLDEALMEDTQGALWPWIFGVVAVDISLASFFWGDYLPTMAAAGGTCVTCDIGNKSR
ncbi:hypothetical protein [Congregibacter sp.]|uniref:hypothetical protein n=1 Tax=Congregibacter sp. TaxID=2744308 RepID=UPI003F6C7DBB